MLRKNDDAEVFRITGARRGLADDVRGRQRRYVISMSVRTVSVVLAAALWNVERHVAVVALVLGVLLPYVAVVIANAGRENSASLPPTFVPMPVRPAVGAGPAESTCADLPCGDSAGGDVSPPGLTAEHQTGGSTSPSTSELANAARLILDNCGISFSQNRIVRLVLKFKDRAPNGNGFLFFQYLTNAVQMTAEQRVRALRHPEVARVISYADPTGEAAVANVMRESRGRR